MSSLTYQIHTEITHKELHSELVLDIILKVIKHLCDGTSKAAIET